MTNDDKNDMLSLVTEKERKCSASCNKSDKVLECMLSSFQIAQKAKKSKS